MWPNPHETVDLATFTEKVFNEKLHFLWSELSERTYATREIPKRELSGREFY